MSKYYYNKSYFKKIDNSEKAYWLGFLYADGCITRFYRNEKLKAMALELTLQDKDIDHLKKIRDCLESNVPISRKIIKDKYIANKIVFCCTDMCRDLINLGCMPQKSLTLSFPNDNVMPQEYVSHFIRGYFDGDGGVHYGENYIYNKQKKNTYLQYSYSCYFSGNENFLASIKNILENNGIRVSKIYSDKRSNNKQIYIYGKENINIFKNYIYKDSTISLSRKFNKFLYIENCDELKINS